MEISTKENKNMEIPTKEDFYVGKSFIFDLCTIATLRRKFRYERDDKRDPIVGPSNGIPFDIMGMDVHLLVKAKARRRMGVDEKNISITVLIDGNRYNGTFIFNIRISETKLVTYAHEYNKVCDVFKVPDKPENVIIPPRMFPEGCQITLKVFFSSSDSEYVEKIVANMTPPRMNINKLLENKYGADVEFKFNDDKGVKLGKIMAHRCILVARSDYFSKMFAEHRWKESKHAVNVSDITPYIFYIFLEFLYGRHDFRHMETDDIYQLYVCADKYMQTDICDLIESYLLDNASPKKAMNDLNFACVYNLDNIKARCIKILINSEIAELEGVMTVNTVELLDSKILRDIIMALIAKKNDDGPNNKKRKLR